MSVIADNLAVLRPKAKNVDLIAVSKTQSVAAITEALRAGQRRFGENRVQEALEKFPALKGDYPDIELHLIGALQTNKARDAVELFDVIQTLDRLRLADALARAMDQTGRRPRLYIEVNIGDEPQKAGIAPDALPKFLAYCRDVCGLRIDGLMCIPPRGRNPCPYFQTMRQLADRFALPRLSMGMSEDYEAAITCGATEIRLGAAVFGTRL